MKVLNVFGWACFAATATCFGAEPGKHGPHGKPPTGGVQSLDVYSTGSVIHLLIGEVPAEGRPVELTAVRSQDTGLTWSDPVRVGATLPAPHNARRGMDPQIAAAGNQAVAAWMTKGTGLFDSGPIATAISQDGGRTWQPGPNPADDSSTAGHGFIDIAADEQGRFHLVWLDSRDGQQGLRYARSADGGVTWSKNETVDAATCECCWNTIAASAGAVALLYRDKDPRDMKVVVRKQAGEWIALDRPAPADWNFEGCPHVGGGAAFSTSKGGPILHTATWTGETEKAGIYYTRSKGGYGGGGWTEPVRFAAASASHPDIAANGATRVAVVWTNTDPKEQGIYVKQSEDGGRTWEDAERISLQGAVATHPRVIVTAAGFRVFWTQSVGVGVPAWKTKELR
jgi:hypothetical protein